MPDADFTPEMLKDVAGAARQSRLQEGEQLKKTPNAEKLRTQRLREDRDDWRKVSERLAIALLNKEALEATVQGWQDRYDDVCERLRRMEGLLGTFQNELGNQKAIQVKALQDKVGHGPTA